MKRTGGESNVVALRLRALGDVLATLDALRALKEADPEREVTYVVDSRFHPLLENEPYIDRLLPSPPKVRNPRDLAAFVRYVRDLRRLRPGTVLDFHSNARSAFLTSLSGAKRRVGYDVKIRKVAYNVVEPRADVVTGAGASHAGADVPRDRIEFFNSAESALRMARHAGAARREAASLPELRVDEEAIRRGAELLIEAGLPGEAVAAAAAVGVNPGRSYPSKAWPETSFVELSRALADRGRPVVVLWGPGEEEAAARIASGAGRGVWMGPAVALEELPGLLRNLSYVVTIDSGLKHLAVCSRVPTVTIFGSTSPREWHIGTERDGYLWKGYSCSPCRRLGCPMGAPCMGDIRPDDVLSEIGRLGLDGDGGES
jgi:heptosyltransferase-1